jgi:hypothetical protein
LQRCQTLRLVFSGRPALVASRLGLDDSLRLSATAVLVYLAGDRGEHVEHHGVEGGEHASRELVARRRKRLLFRMKMTGTGPTT